MSKTSAATKVQYKLSTRKGELVLQAGQVNVHKAASGEAYRVLKRPEGAAEEQLAGDVVAQRSGADLQLDYADGTRLTLQDYFTQCKTGPGCAVTLAGDAPAGHELKASSPEGAKLGDGSSVLYAHGNPEALAGMVSTHQGLEQPLAGLKGELVTYIPQDSSNAGWIAGGAGLAALLGGGGGGGGGSAVAAVQNYVKLSFMGGPALGGNDLTVEVYRADGKTLINTSKLNADGSVTVDAKDYVGVVVVKLVNTGGAVDYLDEATGQGKDLSAQLYTMGVIAEPNSTISLNVNVLTTIAYTKAQEVAGGTPGSPAALSAKQVTDTAAAISKVFQVEDVLHTAAVATNGGGYNAADGLSAGEKYGAVLAAFSGADKLGTGSVQHTVDTVLAGITVSGETAVIKNETQAVLVEGAKVAVPKPSTDDPSGGVSLIVDTYAPVFSSSGTASINENIGAGRVVYTAVASDPSAFSYSLGGADAAAFTVDAKTGAVTLKDNPDFETRAGYSFTVYATDAAGNKSEQGVSLSVRDLDEVPPAAPTVALVQDSGSSSSDHVTGNASLSIGGLEEGAKVQYSANGADWGTNFIPVEGGNTVHVRQIDAAGNVSASSSLSFVLDTSVSAPTVALSIDSGSSATDGITNSGALDVRGLETGATLQYSTNGTSWSSSFTPAQGGNTVYVRQVDAAGNVSAASNALNFTLVAGVAAPTVALRSDSGSSASDHLTNNGALNVGGVEAGATLQYSSNGTSWGSGFTPVEGSNTVYVRQVDSAGNTSDAVPLTFAFDSNAPVFSSSATATSIRPGSHNASVIYTAVASDSHAFSYSLGTGADNAKFSIDAGTGAVTLNEAASGSGYHFTVIATDAAGNASSQAVSLGVSVPPPVSITQLMVETGAHKVGDVVTATIKISGDSGVPLTAISGTVDGFALGNLTRIDATTYTATFTVTEGGQDVAMGQNLPFSFALTDGFERTTANYNQQVIVDNSVTTYAIEVNSHANAADLLSIGFNVTHTYDADLIFKLKAPDGSEITLVSQQGSGGANFVDTVITPGGAALGTGSAPFTGSYAPEQAFSGLTGSAHGTWILTIADVQGADVGFLSDWSIHLSDFNGSSNATAIDAHTPTLTANSPLDDAAQVGAGADLALTFSENVQAGSGHIRVVNDDDSSDTRTISIGDSTQVSISGKVLTINPSSDLLAGGHYHVEIDSGALHDAAGNAFAGIANATTLNFQVAASSSNTLFVKADGLYIDADGSGEWDVGDRLIGAGAALSVNGMSDGNGGTINLAGGAWTVQFLSIKGPELNLSGFGADDFLVVDMSSNTVNGLEAMDQDMGPLHVGGDVISYWGGESHIDGLAQYGEVTRYYYDIANGDAGSDATMRVTGNEEGNVWAQYSGANGLDGSVFLVTMVGSDFDFTTQMEFRLPEPL